MEIMLHTTYNDKCACVYNVYIFNDRQIFVISQFSSSVYYSTLHDKLSVCFKKTWSSRNINSSNDWKSLDKTIPNFKTTEVEEQVAR